MPINLKAPEFGQIESVDQTFGNIIWKQYRSYTVGYFAFVIVCLILTLYFGVVQILFFPAAIGLGVYVFVQKLVEAEFIKQFGTSIGFTYSVTAEKGVGTLFSAGHTQIVSNVLSGVSNGRASRIYSYQYTIGSGKSAHTFQYTVFEVTFGSIMPDITLRNVKEAMAETGLFEKAEHIQLEGDFNTYFILTVPKDYEMEAYQIFTPDVMARLIDKAKDLNFEFNQNKIYIYTTRSLTTRASLQSMLDLAKYLDDTFAHNVSEIHIQEQSK